MSSSSSFSVHRRSPAAGDRNRRNPRKQEWIPRSSATSAPSVVQQIVDKLSRCAVECTSCYEMVRRSTPIWSCSTCFAIFHLDCIRKWARSPAFMSSGDWRCPDCQTVQSTPARDLSYTCFCGRRLDPPNDQNLTPHSCGELCGKPLGRGGEEIGCPHVCALQCHPGPCPPCQAFARRLKCLCGKVNVDRRCSDRFTVLSCGKSCNRLLGCGRHRCERVCHSGVCGSCRELFRAKCFCGKKEEVVACGDVAVTGDVDEESGLFSCNSVCERRLLCGNHECRENCHAGVCGECELLPGRISTCHCGKRKIVDERKSCLDLIPCCSKVCGKPLVCKIHFCGMRCHDGDCPPCSAYAQQRCRCGSSRRTVECYQLFDKRFSFICEKTCGWKKSCGRHRCNERCCEPSESGDRDPHLCSLPCEKKLRCGNHNCQLLCHGGHCSPCLETIFTDLTCACGKTSISAPIPCGTPMPSCQHLCLAAQPCGHPPSHSCHFGDCPPCTLPVMKECVGGHVMLTNIPCCSKDIRCNLQCGKTRQCGIHACARICLPTPCDSSPALESESGVRSSCGQICGAQRRDCKHTCTAPCHPSSSCTEQSCEFVVTILCSCGRITETVPCGTLASSSSFSNDILLQSSVIPDLSVTLWPGKLLCDECEKAETKWQLADAFDESLPNLDALHFGENLETSEVFSELMWRQPKRGIAIDEVFKFMAMVMSEEGCGGNMNGYAFCHILRKKRAAALQIAKRWKPPVQPAGWEQKRFLVFHSTPKPKPVVGLDPGYLMVAADRSAYDPLMDMDPRSVTALLGLSRNGDKCSLVLKIGGESDPAWLNDKNSLALFRDPNHGFSFQGDVMVPRNAGIAALPAAASHAWGVAMWAGNSCKWTVALEVDSCEPDWTLGGRIFIIEWKGNQGISFSENATRQNLLDADAVLASASDCEGGSLQLEDNSVVESVIDRDIEDMSWGQ